MGDRSVGGNVAAYQLSEGCLLFDLFVNFFVNLPPAGAPLIGADER